MTTIGLLTCLWKRPDLTRIVLEYYRDLSDALLASGIRTVPVAVGSQGDECRRIAVDAGFRYIEHDNEPLGAKFNAGMKWFEPMDRGNQIVDGVLVFGSDDLMNRTYIEHVAALKDDFEVMFLEGCHYYDLPTGRCSYYRRNFVGTGAYYSSRFLSRRRFAVWTPTRRTHLDTDAYNNAFRTASPGAIFRHTDEAEYAVVDIKSGTENMWDFDRMKERSHKTFDPVDARPFFDRHFPGVWGKLENMNSQTVQANA